MFHNQIFSKNKKKEQSYPDKIKFLSYCVAIIVPFVVSPYIFKFAHLGLSNEQEVWGQFGDYIGGILNPIFAFFAFIALMITIKLQNEALITSKEELKLTREELEKSRIAQEKQSDSLELQNQATSLQMFENTFFQLLNQHNEYLELVIKEDIKIEYFKYVPFSGNSSGRKADGLKSKEQILFDFREFNQTKRTLKNYFMTLFQILKYINEYEERNDIDAKFYTNIIRALIDDEILRLLAINCVAYPEFIKYKEYIEKYAFFEHIYLNESIEETKTILEILAEYEIDAFDKNIGLVSLINKKAKTEEIPAFVKAE